MWSEPPPPIGAAWCDVTAADEGTVADIGAAEAAGAASTAKGSASAVTAMILIFPVDIFSTFERLRSGL